MSDLISRQAAIDALNSVDEYNARSVKAIKELPPVQPDIIRCKDCKFWTYIKTHKKHWCKTDDGLYDLNPSADDFCSRAERRSNGHN